MRGYRAVTAVIAATVIVAAGTHLGGQNSGPGRVGTGAASGQRYIATTGTDSGNCATSGTACLTPAYAWGQASSGDTINVADGTYSTTLMGSLSGSGSDRASSGCTLTGAKTSATTFKGGSGAIFGCYFYLSGANYAGFQGNSNSDRLQIQRLGVSGTGASNVTILNVDFTCQDTATYVLETPGNKCTSNAANWNGSNWSVTNFSVGPNYDSSACTSNPGNGDASKLPLTNSTLTNGWFHDQRYQTGQAGCNPNHSENIYLTGTSGTTWDRIYISNGTNSGAVTGTGSPNGAGPDTAALFLTKNGTTPHDFTINNMRILGAQCGINGSIDAPLSNVVIQNSSLPCGITPQYTDYASAFTLRNDIIGSSTGTCPGSGKNVVYDHNLFVYTGSGGSFDDCNTGGRGGTGTTGNVIKQNTTGITVSFTSAIATSDLHLVSGSAAIGIANGTTFAADDFDANLRPCGGTPDAGAYEFGC